MKSADTYLSEGFRLAASNRTEAACRSFRWAALLEPSQAVQMYALGHLDVQNRDWRSAEVTLSRALMCLRREASPRLLALIPAARGVARRRLNREPLSRTDYRRALVADPGDRHAYSGLIASDLRSSSDGEALIRARRGLVVDPRSDQAWNDLAALLSNSGRTAEAGAPYRRALVLSPGKSVFWNNLGILFKVGHRIGEAIACFSRAVASDPRNQDAWPNLGRNLLLSGDFARGWPALEHNSRARGLQPKGRSFSVPPWDGDPLEDGALLLWSDERIGDEILFASQLDQIRDRAGSVVLLCSPRLFNLFSKAFPGITVVSWDGRAPLSAEEVGATARYPLEYAGRFVRRKFADFPAPRAYLKDVVRGLPTPERPAGLRVGLSWRSANRAVGQQKSQGLIEWESILRTPGVEFVNLQYGAVADELEAVESRFGISVRNHADRDQIDNFEGFCELVRSLDVVITIANTTAHAAGALGVPTWIMLPRGAGLSWFWFDERDTSLWYPDTTLFRQSEIGRWEPVVRRVAERLHALQETCGRCRA